MPFNSEEKKLLAYFGTPRGIFSLSSGVPIHGVNSVNHILNRSTEPPISQNGCSRATPILAQRFGIHFNRKFSQPNGAPYPLRPSLDSRYQQMQPASSDTRLREAPLRTQSVPPTKPRAFSQTSVTDVMAHNMALAFGTSCFAGLNSLSMPQPSCAPQVEQAAPSAPLAAPRLETEEQLLEVEIEKILKKEEIKMEETENEAEHLQEYNPTETVAQARPYRDPILIAQSLEEAWKSVYNEREKLLTHQKSGKMMELEELKTSFSMGTSVKDILCSEWYRDQLTLKLQNCDDLPLALKGTRPRRTGRKKKETSIPELIATYMANPPPSRPTQKKTHQRHLLPVKVQKQTISQEVPSQSHQSQRQPQNRLQNHPQHDPQHQLQNQSQNQTQHHLQQLPQHPLQHQIQHHSQQHPQQHSQHHSLHYPQQQPQNHSQNHVQHHNDFYNQTSNLSNNIPPQHEPVQTQQQTIIGQDYIEVPQSHQGQGTSQFSLMSQPETRTAVYTQPTAIDPRMNLSLGDFIAQSSNLTLQLQQEELLKATSAAAMILQPSISQQPTNNNRGNSLLTPDLSSAQLTPTGNRSGTPNILRKFRGNEGCSSPAYSEKGLLHSSTSSPSKIHLTNNLEAVESAQSYLQPQTTPETPRRRERKQKLVSDHHYQSSQLYSLLQDDQKPEEKKKEPGRELTYFMNMDSQPETSNETGSIMWGEAEIKIEIPEEKYTPPQKKRGRPRKDRVANVPQQPRKTKGPYKPRQPKQPKQQKVAHQPQSIPEKKTGQNDYETAEMERKALLQALPSNLQDAIKAQKVMDKEEKKTPRKYVKKPKQPSVEEEEDAVNSVAASLQFLQSIANMNSAMLFAGLNPALLTDSPLTPLSPPIVPVPQIAQQIYPEAIQHSPQYFNQQLVNKVVPHVVPQFKAPAKPKAAPKKENIAKDQLILPPPTATAVATSGTPLIINFYEKTPQIEAAHVWTDDSGPLVPQSMYQKVEKKSILNSVDQARQEINSAEFIEQEKTSPPVYKPKIITKAALKYIPEPIRAKNETEYGQQGDGTDQLNPPPPWMSAKNAERRKAPLLNRNIPKVTKPVVMKPVKTVATTLKQKLTSRQLILMMNNFAQQLKEFEFSMFTSKHRSTELVSMEESEVSRIINGKFDQLVQTCVSAVFEEDGPSHLITHSKEQPAFRLKINWKSRDSEPRWLLWHETHVTNCVKHVKKAMVKQKMAEVDKMTTRIERQVDKIKNPRAKHTVDLLSQQIEQIHGNLLSKLNSFKESFRIPIGKAFKHKLKAIEDRLARWISIKNKYRQTKVENFTLAWKAATDNYTAAVDSADKEVKMLIMLRSYQNLTDALEMNDALVDVCMIASRLQVLYFHAFGVFKQMVDVVESRIVVQCLEDTEQFLVLAESKVKLLEDKAEIDKLNMINLYMQADKMNVERGRLRRMLSVNADKALLERCEERMKHRVNNFVSALVDMDLLEIASFLPSKKWSEVVVDEEKQWGESQKFTTRLHLFHLSQDENYDYSKETVPKLFARRTCKPIITQMLVAFPQVTNIIDEKLLERAEEEKAEPKLLLQSILPLFKGQNVRCQEKMNEMSTTLKKKDFKMISKEKALEQEQEADLKFLNSIRRNVKLLGAVVTGDDLVEYNPADHDEQQLNVVIQNKMNEFRTRKREQALKRRRLIANSKQEVFEDDDDRMQRKKTRKSHESEESSSESESEPKSNDIVSVLDSIRSLNKSMHLSENEGSQKEFQRLLQIKKTEFEQIQKIKREERMAVLNRIDGGAIGRDAITDAEFDDMLEGLFSYTGHDADEISGIEQFQFASNHLMDKADKEKTKNEGLKFLLTETPSEPAEQIDIDVCN